MMARLVVTNIRVPRDGVVRVYDFKKVYLPFVKGGGGGAKISMGVQIFHPISEILVP